MPAAGVVVHLRVSDGAVACALQHQRKHIADRLDGDLSQALHEHTLDSVLVQLQPVLQLPHSGESRSERDITSGG